MNPFADPPMTMAEMLRQAGKETVGLGDAAWTAGKGMVAQPVAAWGAMYDLLKGRGVKNAVRNAEGLQGRLVGEPRTQEGADILGRAGEAVKTATKPFSDLADYIGEQSPAAGGAAMAMGAAIDPTKLAKVLRMSAAEARRLGYYHPVGKNKLAMPVDQMTSTHVPVDEPLAPRRSISPEDLQGSVLVPAYGDRSRAGSYLTHVGDDELTNPVLMQGGADFMRMFGPKTGGVWANAGGAATALANQIRRAADKGNGRVFMPYVSMGHDSLGFNANMSDTLVDLLRQREVSPQAMQMFDEAMRGGGKGQMGRADFPGLQQENLAEMLRQGPGKTRTALTDLMEKKPFQDAGFPDVAQVRKAITDPALLDATESMGGYNVSEMDPSGRLIHDPAALHETFPVQIGGQYAGSFDQQVPRNILFPDWFKEREASGLAPGKRLSADSKSFMGQAPLQPANQEWLDRVMGWIEASRAAGQ